MMRRSFWIIWVGPKSNHKRPSKREAEGDQSQRGCTYLLQQPQEADTGWVVQCQGHRLCLTCCSLHRGLRPGLSSRLKSRQPRLRTHGWRARRQDQVLSVLPRPRVFLRAQITEDCVSTRHPAPICSLRRPHSLGERYFHLICIN